MAGLIAVAMAAPDISKFGISIEFKRALVTHYQVLIFGSLTENLLYLQYIS